MRMILAGIRSFLAEDFEPREYLGVALFLGAAIALNYSTNFTSGVLFGLPFDLSRILGFVLLLAVGYYVPVLLRCWGRHDPGILRSRGFWLRSASAILFLALNFSLFLLYPVVELAPIPDESFDFVLRLLVSLSSIVIFGLYAGGSRVLFDRNRPNAYGLTTRGVHWNIYLLLLLAVVPLLLLASFSDEFLRVYPTYRPGRAAESLGIAPAVLAVIYEAIYLIDFLFVELFYRGLLVIGMARLMGRGAVLPMVSLYAFAHFGKPMPETISSCIGGLILGIIAFNTRSISGGVLIHAGVALLMEVFAAIQHTLRGGIDKVP